MKLTFNCTRINRMPNWIRRRTVHWRHSGNKYFVDGIRSGLYQIYDDHDNRMKKDDVIVVNKIGEEGVMMMSEALKTNTSLTRLSLSREEKK